MDCCKEPIRSSGDTCWRISLCTTFSVSFEKSALIQAALARVKNPLFSVVKIAGGTISFKSRKHGGNGNLSSERECIHDRAKSSFGISRTSVDLVARVVTLDSRKRRLGIVMSDHQDEMMAIGQHFVREAHCLLLEADIWGNSLCALPQHPRVTVSVPIAELTLVR